MADVLGAGSVTRSVSSMILPSNTYEEDYSITLFRSACCDTLGVVAKHSAPMVV